MASSSSGPTFQASNRTLVLRPPPLQPPIISNVVEPTVSIKQELPTQPTAPSPSLPPSPTLYLCPSCPTSYATLLERSHHVHNWHERSFTIRTALEELVFNRGEEDNKLRCNLCSHVALPADAFGAHVLRCQQQTARREEEEEVSSSRAVALEADTPFKLAPPPEPPRAVESADDADMQDEPRTLDKGKGREQPFLVSSGLVPSTPSASSSSSSTFVPQPTPYFSTFPTTPLGSHPPPNPLPFPSPSDDFKPVPTPSSSSLLPASTQLVCPVCSRCFGHKGSLNSHFSDNHAPTRSMTTKLGEKFLLYRGDDQKLPCPKCSYRHPVGAAMRKHLDRDHRVGKSDVAVRLERVQEMAKKASGGLSSGPVASGSWGVFDGRVADGEEVVGEGSSRLYPAPPPVPPLPMLPTLPTLLDSAPPSTLLGSTSRVASLPPSTNPFLDATVPSPSPLSPSRVLPGSQFSPEVSSLAVPCPPSTSQLPSDVLPSSPLNSVQAPSTSSAAPVPASTSNAPTFQAPSPLHPPITTTFLPPAIPSSYTSVFPNPPDRLNVLGTPSKRGRPTNVDMAARLAAQIASGNFSPEEVAAMTLAAQPKRRKSSTTTPTTSSLAVAPHPSQPTSSPLQHPLDPLTAPLTGTAAALAAYYTEMAMQVDANASLIRRLEEAAATRDIQFANLDASKFALGEELEGVKLALEEERYSRTVDVSRLEEEQRLLVVSREEERARLEKVIEGLKVDKGSAQMGQQSLLDEKRLLEARHVEEKEAWEKKIEEMRVERELARSEKEVVLGEKDMVVLELEEETTRWEGEKKELTEAMALLEVELLVAKEEEAASASKVESLEKEKKKLKLEVEKASKLTAELLANVADPEENDPTPTRRATRGSTAAQAIVKACTCHASPLPRSSLKRQRLSEPIEPLVTKHSRLVEPSPSLAPLPLPSPASTSTSSSSPKPPPSLPNLESPMPEAGPSSVPKVEKPRRSDSSAPLDEKFAMGIPPSGVDRENFLKFWTEKIVKQKSSGSVCHFCLKAKTPSSSSSTPLQLSSDASDSSSTRVQKVIAHLESSHWTSWQRVCQPGGIIGAKSVD